MKQRTTALLLAVALALSLLGAGALAAEGGVFPVSGEQAAETALAGERAPEAPEESGVLSQSRSVVPEEDEVIPLEEYRPDPVGTISFANLGSRMRENSYSLLSLEENIAAVESLNYDVMTEEIRDAINQTANAQWGMITSVPMLGSMMAASLDATYDSLRNTFDDLKKGKLQEDNAAIVRQLRNAQDQVVMMGETLYITLAGLELNDSSLDRSLAALDRTIRELELRYELGHISSLTLQTARGGRTSLVSGQQTLEMNIHNLKLQLELMIGAELTGGIRLQPLPQVTQAQLNGMDLESDLAAAKEISYQLFAAQRTLDDAKKAFKDANKGKQYKRDQAQHTLNAAQYTYETTIQNFEMSFRTLYAQVKDYKQILDAARTALAVEQNNYSVARLKQSQGTLSLNGLLEAEDKLNEAKEKVAGAENDLFSAYNTYRWAVDYGILN